MSEARWNPGPPPKDDEFYVLRGRYGGTEVYQGKDANLYSGAPVAHYGPIPKYDPPPPAPVLPDKPTCFVAKVDRETVHGVYSADKSQTPFAFWHDSRLYGLCHASRIADFDDFRWLPDGNPLGSEGAK